MVKKESDDGKREEILEQFKEASAKLEWLVRNSEEKARMWKGNFMGVQEKWNKQCKTVFFLRKEIEELTEKNREAEKKADELEKRLLPLMLAFADLQTRDDFAGIVVGSRYQILGCSKNIHEYLGQRQEDIVGKDIEDVLTVDILPLYAQGIKNITEGWEGKYGVDKTEQVAKIQGKEIKLHTAVMDEFKRLVITMEHYKKPGAFRRLFSSKPKTTVYFEPDAGKEELDAYFKQITDLIFSQDRDITLDFSNAEEIPEDTEGQQTCQIIKDYVAIFPEQIYLSGLSQEMYDNFSTGENAVSEGHLELRE